jgi:hypothetical protein
VSHVTREVDAAYIFILLVEFTDNLPGAVTAAIVDKHHHRIVGDEPFGYHTLEKGCESLHGVNQHLFLIITR